MAFKLNLSPELQAKIDAQAAEALRLYGLPDRWLGAQLLKLCREIRNATPYRRRGEHDTYNSALLWDIVPEVARRLGAPLQADESLSRNIRMLQGQDLRDYVSICMSHVSVAYLQDARTDAPLDPIDVLFRESANGNPVLIALDRLVPPTPESKDNAARHLREISNNRGHEETAAWHPGLNDEPSAPILGGMGM